MRYLAITLVLLLLLNPVVTLAENYVESIVVNVHRDGSVSITTRASTSLTYQPHPFTFAEVALTAELGEHVIIEADLTLELLERFNGSIAMSIKSSTRPINQQLVSSTSSIFVHFSDMEGNALIVNVTRLNATLNSETLVYRYIGDVEVKALGRAVEILQSIPMLIASIQYQVQADPSIRDVLKIIELKYELGEATVVKFDIEFNYYQYLSRLYPGLANRIKELSGNISTNLANCPFNVEAGFNLTRNLITARYYEKAGCSLSSYLNITTKVLEIIPEFMNATVIPGSTYIPGAPSVYSIELAKSAFNRVTSLLARLSEEFEVKPSTASLTLRLEGRQLNLELKTPRIVKRGAQTPSDTLRALYDFTVDTVRELELEKAGISVEKLEETSVAIQAEQGVKVKLAGEEVREVKFADLERVDVEVEKPEEQPVFLYAVSAIVAIAVGVSLYILIRRR